MFGSIVMGVQREHFEAILKQKKAEVGVTDETHLDARHLRELVSALRRSSRKRLRRSSPMSRSNSFAWPSMPSFPPGMARAL